MRAKDIAIGEYYRHRASPNYCWAKPVKVLGPMEGENPHKRIVVKCEWTTDKDPRFALIKYFRPSDLIAKSENMGVNQ